MNYQISRRRLLATGAVALPTMALGLQGCTSPTQQAGTGSKRLSLLILGPTSEMVKYLNDTALPAFTKQSGYAVDLQTSDWGSAFQKVTTQAASRSLPDVFVIGGIWTAPLAEKKALLDLTDQLQGWDERGQFYEGMLEDCKYQGKYYAVPSAADVRTGLYRQDLLEKTGVRDLPTTWDEFLEAARQVKASAVEGLVAPIDWNLNKSIGIQQTFAQLFLSAGGQYFNDQGKATFNSEPGHKALGLLVQTYKEGLANINQVDSGNGPMALVQGKSAMTLNGQAILYNAQQNAPDIESKIAVGTALKANDASPRVSVSWVNKYAIGASTTDVEGSWKLLTYLCGQGQIGELARLWGTLPPRRDLADSSWLTAGAREILSAAENTTSQPRDPRMMQLGPAVRDLLEPALRGKTTVDETLRAIDEKLNSL